MATDVVMPQMGESIAEGTIVRWIKKVGDQVARDEPLFEISTDKVDAEIPSPAAGVVAEIRVKEGETVPVNSVVAVIGLAGQPADAASAPSPPPAPAPPPSTPAPSASSATPGDVRPMSVMRKKIAEHMIMSRRTSAHVHSVFEVNFSGVAKVRDARRAEFEKSGAKLTYMSFIIKAAADALRAVPIVNASIDGDNIVYHRDVNIGVAVALDWGLIVPVIKKADELNLLGLSRSLADLATRARSKQLKPDDVAGATLTITNPGVFGALFGMPIISQPQVAILGVGNIE